MSPLTLPPQFTPIHTCISSSWLPCCWRWCIYCLYTSFCELETFAKLFVDFVQFLEGNPTLHGTHPTRPFHWTAEKMPLWMIPVVCGLPLCAVPQNCQFNSVSWNSSGFLIGPCKFHLCDLFTFTRWWLNTDVWSHRVLSHTDVLFVQCVFWCSCSFWQPMQCRRFVPTPCHHNVSTALFSV